jgi:hypothetical protein
MAAYANDPNASNAQSDAEQLAMMTACTSKAEWLQAAKKYTGKSDADQNVVVAHGTNPSSVYKAMCDAHFVGQVGRGSANAPGCRNK